MKTILLALAATLALSACQTNPVTGRKQLMLVSEDTAISESKQAYVEMLKPLAKEGKIDSQPATAQRVREITGRLIAQAIKYRPETEGWEWSVKVIDDPKTVNAWCMAGGKMAIYTGLLQQIKPTDDELAQVMGHEISHALAKHTAEKMSRAMAMQVGMVGLGVAASTQDSRYAGLAVSAAGAAAIVALELPNSREAESEADRIGIELAAKAGYDPHAAVTLWEKMAKAGGGSSRFDFLSTHPAPAKRMETLAALVPQMMPYYQDKSPRPVYPIKDVPIAAIAVRQIVALRP
ncbi:MAG TPA: M48 family metallopeptidase [Burkholderiales bacterium]|jgi:predicted Zn-dependent protease|nr:M48 family metallopeptidase [Burkholderiales bacterium]